MTMIDGKLYEDIGRYARELKNYPNNFNPEDPDNREKLICKNMRIPVDLAVKFGVKYSLDDDDVEELIGQGMLGLCTAYDKYDPNKECFEGKRASFSSVAWFWVNAMEMSAVKKMLDRKTKRDELFEDIPEPHQRSVEKYELLYEGIGEIDIYLMRLRYGLEDGKPMTYREISKMTGFRVSLIKRSVNSAMDRMRENVARHGIKWSDVVSE